MGPSVPNMDLSEHTALTRWLTLAIDCCFPNNRQVRVYCRVTILRRVDVWGIHWEGRVDVWRIHWEGRCFFCCVFVIWCEVFHVRGWKLTLNCVWRERGGNLYYRTLIVENRKEKDDEILNSLLMPCMQKHDHWSISNLYFYETPLCATFPVKLCNFFLQKRIFSGNWNKQCRIHGSISRICWTWAVKWSTMHQNRICLHHFTKMCVKNI